MHWLSSAIFRPKGPPTRVGDALRAAEDARVRVGQECPEEVCVCAGVGLGPVEVDRVVAIPVRQAAVLPPREETWLVRTYQIDPAVGYKMEIAAGSQRQLKRGPPPQRRAETTGS